VHEAGSKQAADAAIAQAKHVIKHRMRISRLTTNAMEPRGAVAEWDARDQR
jgi:Molybdopterin-binding domain of aldehyde dehydrogenase.